MAILEWLVILVGCKIKSLNKLENLMIKNLKIHLCDYAHYIIMG